MQFQNHYTAPGVTGKVLRATDGVQNLDFLWQSDLLDQETREALLEGRELFDVLFLRMQIAVTTDSEGRSTVKLISRSFDLVAVTEDKQRKFVRIMLSQNQVRNREELDRYWPKREIPESANRNEYERRELYEERMKVELVSTMSQISMALVNEVQRRVNVPGPAEVPLMFIREWTGVQYRGVFWCIGGKGAFQCRTRDGHPQTLTLMFETEGRRDNDTEKWVLKWWCEPQQPRRREIIFRELWLESVESYGRPDFTPEDNTEDMLKDVPLLIASVATWIVRGKVQRGGIESDADISDLVPVLSVIDPDGADVERSIFTGDLRVYFDNLRAGVTIVRAGPQKRAREDDGGVN